MSAAGRPLSYLDISNFVYCVDSFGVHRLSMIGDVLSTFMTDSESWAMALTCKRGLSHALSFRAGSVILSLGRTQHVLSENVHQMDMLFRWIGHHLVWCGEGYLKVVDIFAHLGMLNLKRGNSQVALSQEEAASELKRHWYKHGRMTTSAFRVRLQSQMILKQAVLQNSLDMVNGVHMEDIHGETSDKSQYSYTSCVREPQVRPVTIQALIPRIRQAIPVILDHLLHTKDLTSVKLCIDTMAGTPSSAQIKRLATMYPRYACEQAFRSCPDLMLSGFPTENAKTWANALLGGVSECHDSRVLAGVMSHIGVDLDDLRGVVRERGSVQEWSVPDINRRDMITRILVGACLNPNEDIFRWMCDGCGGPDKLLSIYTIPEGVHEHTSSLVDAETFQNMFMACDKGGNAYIKHTLTLFVLEGRGTYVVKNVHGGGTKRFVHPCIANEIMRNSCTILLEHSDMSSFTGGYYQQSVTDRTLDIIAAHLEECNKGAAESVPDAVYDVWLSSRVVFKLLKNDDVVAQFFRRNGRLLMPCINRVLCTTVFAIDSSAELRRRYKVVMKELLEVNELSGLRFFTDGFLSTYYENIHFPGEVMRPAIDVLISVGVPTLAEILRAFKVIQSYPGFVYLCDKEHVMTHMVKTFRTRVTDTELYKHGVFNAVNVFHSYPSVSTANFAIMCRAWTQETWDLCSPCYIYGKITGLDAAVVVLSNVGVGGSLDLEFAARTSVIDFKNTVLRQVKALCRESGTIFEKRCSHPKMYELLDCIEKNDEPKFVGIVSQLLDRWGRR